MGGLFLSNLSNAVIVSMGTGTAFVKAEEGRQDTQEEVVLAVVLY